MQLASLKDPGILSVTQLNGQIKTLLESQYRLVWVQGEISNFRTPASGHHYFTLKDEQSQIRAVFFRGQQRSLRFALEAGLQVICQGRVSVYEPRGEYQLIVEVMEPQGIGALQLAFDQLKKKLAGEGLFDAHRKRVLPACPRHIAIVTSPTGAAIRDMLKTLQRSPYPLTVTLLPVRVQGQEAGPEIAAAIGQINSMADRFGWDLVVVGRGGGSMEDLWPFNEETVARSLAECIIPTISAVGHEIDFTISDLVADLRAPTPTAAAEWVVHQLEHTQRELAGRHDQLRQLMTLRIDSHRQRLGFLEKRLVHPKRRLEDSRLLVDDRLDRLQLAFMRRVERLRSIHAHLKEKLQFHHPLKSTQRHRTLVNQTCKELFLHHRAVLDQHRFGLQKCAAQLEGLSPLGVLARGYSITTRLPDGKVVRRWDDVEPEQVVQIRLGEGALECTVRGRKRNDTQNFIRMGRGEEEE